MFQLTIYCTDRVAQAVHSHHTVSMAALSAHPCSWFADSSSTLSCFRSAYSGGSVPFTLFAVRSSTSSLLELDQAGSVPLHTTTLSQCQDAPSHDRTLCVSVAPEAPRALPAWEGTEQVKRFCDRHRHKSRLKDNPSEPHQAYARMTGSLLTQAWACSIPAHHAASLPAGAQPRYCPARF